MPLQARRGVSDLDLRLTRSKTVPGSMQRPRSPGRTLSPLDATYDSFSRSMSPLHGATSATDVTYNTHDKLKHKARSVTKPLTGGGTRYIGGDVVLLRSARTMNDGAKWALAAVEVGSATQLQVRVALDAVNRPWRGCVPCLRARRWVHRSHSCAMHCAVFARAAG